MVVTAIIAFASVAFFHLAGGQKSRSKVNEDKLKRRKNS
jgi:hypothetical protein